jgi:hypothetical protein
VEKQKRDFSAVSAICTALMTNQVGLSMKKLTTESSSSVVKIAVTLRRMLGALIFCTLRNVNPLLVLIIRVEKQKKDTSAVSAICTALI